MPEVLICWPPLLLPEFQLFAVDCPGTGLSSPYPNSVLPYWKNDAFLLLKIIEALKLERFAIVAHSLGALIANVIALTIPQKVTKLVFLDILGPTVNFYQNFLPYLHSSVHTYLTHDPSKRNVFPDEESAVLDRIEKKKY